MNFLFQYVLVLADDSLILAQRLSEWAYKAPFLEEDIALSNISLDLFGRANMLFEYAVNVKGDDFKTTVVRDLSGNSTVNLFCKLGLLTEIRTGAPTLRLSGWMGVLGRDSHSRHRDMKIGADGIESAKREI